MSIITGALFHATGASSASCCYTPQNKTIAWSWQTFWLAQAVINCLLLPIIVSSVTIPHWGDVLTQAQKSAMYNSFILGAAYGVGGTAFGIAIQYVGFPFTYAVSVGIPRVIGTWLPPLVHGELATIFDKTGSGPVLSGVATGGLGIAICGLAGRVKEKGLEEIRNLSSSFPLAKGLPLCFLAGTLSSIYGFALDQGQPIADTAAQYGAGHFQGNAIYIFANSGALLTTAIYCMYLHIKHNTFGECQRLPETKRFAALSINYAMAFLIGLLWYSQFFLCTRTHSDGGIQIQQLGNSYDYASTV